jgi:predicted  nucleic acid-binding Zn-ribbon protein
MTDSIESQRGAIRALSRRLQTLETKKKEIQDEIDRVTGKIEEQSALLRLMYERKSQES